MQSHKVCILIATLIAISLQSCLALTCFATNGTSSTCPDNSKECYIKTDTNGISKGCIDTNATTCTSPNCLSCSGDNCNYLMCRHCLASQTECATTNVTADTFNQLCATPNQVCVNRVNGNQTVTRGCDSQCAADDVNCSSCKEDNCNAANTAYPESWRHCYRCSGDSCNTVNNATMLLPCDLYQKEGQKCYTIGTNATTMQRGCSTDTEAKCKTDKADASCLFCDNENGCNNREFESVLGSCIKCNNNDTCVPAQQEDKAAPCAASNYTLSENSCFHQMNANGIVERGCTNERTLACNPTDDCQTCNGTACNVGDSTFTCLICRSDNFWGCREALTGPEPCKNSTSKQCFEGEWDGVVVRGCLDDTGPLMRYQCENKDDTRCKICATRNCNKLLYSGAATLQHMGLGLLLGLIFVIRQS